jgi:pimeloyl-ACP methyl ester carboxylesterase
MSGAIRDESTHETTRVLVLPSCLCTDFRNLHIYDELIPYLVASGRRVVAFDFLGFGASDKPSGAIYSFKQQRGDLEAVVDAILDRIVPVPHDSSGPAAINFTLAHPERATSLCILNSGYDDALPILWPEMIERFANKKLNALSGAIAQKLSAVFLATASDLATEEVPRSFASKPADAFRHSHSAAYR